VRGTIVFLRVRIMIGGAEDAVERGFGRHRDCGIDQTGVAILAALNTGVEIVQHVTGQRHLLGGTLQTDPVATRGDVHAQSIFQRDQIAVILAEQLRQHLRLVEAEFRPAAFTGLGGEGLAAHAVLSPSVGFAKMGWRRSERQRNCVT
jgi:hypothetical protein